MKKEPDTEKFPRVGFSLDHEMRGGGGFAAGRGLAARAGRTGRRRSIIRPHPDSRGVQVFGQKKGKHHKRIVLGIINFSTHYCKSYFLGFVKNNRLFPLRISLANNQAGRKPPWGFQGGFRSISRGRGIGGGVIGRGGCRSRWYAGLRRSRSKWPDRRWSKGLYIPLRRRSCAWSRGGSCRNGSWAGV